MELRIERTLAAFKRIGVSRATGYRMVREGKLPPLIKVSTNASGFLTDEITAYLRARVVESRGEAQ